MENTKATIPVKPSSAKLAGSLALLVLWAAFVVYNWLVRNDAVAGRVFFTNFALLGLGLSLFILSKTPLARLKRRWEKVSLLILAILAAGLIALGVVNIFRLFYEYTRGDFIGFYIVIIMVAVAVAVAHNYQLPWPRKGAIFIAEEQAEGKPKIRHPLFLAAGIFVLLLWMACETYNWLVLKEAIAGSKLVREYALYTIGLSLILLVRVDIKHRWVKATLWVMGLVTAGLFAAGVADMLSPIPGLLQKALSDLSFVVPVLFMLFAIWVAWVYSLPNKKENRTRMQNNRVALLLILGILAMYGLLFGPKYLILWLLTRG